MKILVLLSAALLVAGCGEKSLSDSEIEQILEKAVELDSLQKRNDLYYQPNKSKPYSGWVKETYDDSEQAEELFEVQNGKQEGRYIKWDEDGHKRSEENYKNGKQDGLITTWHENGQKQGEMTLKDGKPVDGLLTSWHENGQKQGEITYKDGKPDGRQTSWHENGQKAGERTYKDGEEISAKYWNSKGEEVETWQEVEK